MFGLEQAIKGKGSILFVTGEAGIGKTRLVQELPNQEMPFKFELLTGQCIYRDGTDPYLPFIEMFKGYLSSHPYLATSILSSMNSPASVIFDSYSTEKSRYKPDSGAIEKQKQIEQNSSNSSIDALVSDVGSEVEVNQPNPQTTTSTEVTPPKPEIHERQLLEGKHRMFETVTKIIIDISKSNPLVLFLDDMQWADVASLHLLHYLARNIKNQPILIIGAYRPEDLDYTRGSVHPMQELITRLGTENLYSTIELTRINQEAAVQMVRDLLDVENIPNEFNELIYSETEGNPFFIKEVLRSLVEEGALSVKQDKLVLNKSPDKIVIPTSIKELIKLRLQRLEEQELEVLEYASVIGNEFDLELLDNIIDIPESKLINILSELTEARFIEDFKDDKSFNWKFTHNKIFEVIYNEINDNKKKLIHLKLAKYLEDSKIDNVDEVVYALAYHFYHGFDFDRALSYSIEGGEKAIKTYANQDALDLYNISLNSLRRLDEELANTKHYQEKKIEVLSKLGILNKTLGEWDKALEYYEQILPISDAIKSPQIKSRTYLNMGWIYQQRSFWNEAQNYFQKSLSMAKVMQDFNISAEAYNGLGAVCERKGMFEEAIEYYTTSRKFAQENYDLLNLAKAHNAFGRIYNQLQIFPKAVEHKQKSISLFDRIKDLPELAKAYTSLALTFYDMGDLNKNIEFNEKCIELADEIADIRIKGYGLSNAVESLVKTQQLDKALDYASSALEIFKKLEERFMISLNYMNFGIIFKHKKEWNKSKYYFKTAIEFMENLKIPYHLADCYQQFAGMYKAKGEAPKATYYLEKAREIYISLAANGYIKKIDDELKNFSVNGVR